MNRTVLTRLSAAAPITLTAVMLVAARNPAAQAHSDATPPTNVVTSDEPVVATSPDTAVDPRVASTEAALAALAAHVKRSSHSDALRVAFQAYFNYRAAHPDLVRKPYLYFVDLGLNNATARGYVFDMEALTLIDGPFMVAHGRGSSRERNGVPTLFSNRSGSNASSLGLYLAQETYRFGGKTAGRRYSSVGLRLDGESGAFNSAARARGVVAHGAPYVTSSGAGRSEGCPAMELRRADRLLPLLSDGGVVFIYSPRSERWLAADPWVNAIPAAPSTPAASQR